jgi:hypothetical protein
MREFNFTPVFRFSISVTIGGFYVLMMGFLWYCEVTVLSYPYTGVVVVMNVLCC